MISHFYTYVSVCFYSHELLLINSALKYTSKNINVVIRSARVSKKVKHR